MSREGKMIFRKAVWRSEREAAGCFQPPTLKYLRCSTPSSDVHIGFSLWVLFVVCISAIADLNSIAQRGNKVNRKASKIKNSAESEKHWFTQQHHKSIISQKIELVKKNIIKINKFYEVNKKYLWSFYKLPYCKMQKSVVYYSRGKEGKSQWKTELGISVSKAHKAVPVKIGKTGKHRTRRCYALHK